MAANDHEGANRRAYVEYLRAAGRVESTELFAAAGAVTDLLEHPGWVFIQGLIGRSRQECMDRLLNAVAQNQAEAAQLAGLVQGIDATRECARAVLEAASRRREQNEREPEAAGAAGRLG